MKTLTDWTRKDFETLPCRNWDEDIGEFDSLVILPTRHIHDSGYRCMDFIAVKGDTPFVRLSGCSDVIHIDGIGGYGKDWVSRGGVPMLIEPKGWRIDSLKKSGLLRLFANGKMTVGAALSSFDVYNNTKGDPK